VDREPAVQLALARKRELEAELQEIDTFLELYRKFSKTNGSSDTQQLIQSAADHAEQPEKRIRSRGMSQVDFEQIAREIMLSQETPIYREGLLAEFHKIGRHLGTGDEMGNLKTKLWRATAESKTIVRIPGSGYWPKDVPCPAVNYVPETEKPPL
jgi:hypothetical protein